jgi:hypothetical protein
VNYAKLPDCQSRRSSHESQRGGRWLRKAKINTDNKGDAVRQGKGNASGFAGGNEPSELYRLADRA